MRILMLGNSLIFANDMPRMLAQLTGAQVVHHTRGGARLSEQLNPKTRLGTQTQAALSREHWDYVILQEMSHGRFPPLSVFSPVQGSCAHRFGQPGLCPFSMPPGPTRKAAPNWQPRAGTTTKWPIVWPKPTALPPGKTAPSLPRWGCGFTSWPTPKTYTPPTVCIPVKRAPASLPRPSRR